MAGIKGEAIFLVESWAISDRITSIRIRAGWLGYTLVKQGWTAIFQIMNRMLLQAILTVMCQKSSVDIVKLEISVRLLTQKSEWILLSTKYANIRSPAELNKFVKSTWLKEYCDELFKEFNNIKSYVVRNWPGASRLGIAAAA
ncbi:hypothetical protein DL98DRAFT_577538 [Cadophora sp. DSE1049]|nr:hypothetical protein DL98DRAFT_577538 [Cadophora sp. DSE1049]